MPNDCYNRLTITSNSDTDIASILQEINKDIPNVIVLQKSKHGLRVQYNTAWTCHFQFIESLLNKYPLAWIKNEWISEDGTSGICIGTKNNIKTMEWHDLSIDEEHYYFSCV